MFFAAQVLLFAVLPLLLVNRWLGLTGLFAMGLLMYLLNTPVQVHSLGLAEAEYPAAASLCASVQPVSYNFGIAVGSFAGSLVQDAWGLRLLGVPAAVFAGGRRREAVRIDPPERAFGREPRPAQPDENRNFQRIRNEQQRPAGGAGSGEDRAGKAER